MDPKTGQQQGQGGEGGEGASAGAPSMDEIRKLVAEQVTGAFNRFKGTLGKDLEGQIKSYLTPLQERLEHLAHREEPQLGQGTGAGGAGDAAAKAAEIAAQKRDAEIKALKLQVEAERKAREDEKAARMQQEERGALQQALTEAGVDPAMIGMTVGYLYTETRRVTRDDKGGVGFKVAGQYGEELLPLKDGINQWLKTDEGKRCLPTRPAAGAGTSPSRAPGAQRTHGAPSAREVGLELGAALGYTNGT